MVGPRPGRLGVAALLGALLALLVPAAALAKAPADEASARSAVRGYRRLVDNVDGLTRLLALRDLAAHDHPIVVDLALEEFETRALERYRGVRKLLSAFRAPETITHLVENGLEHRDPRVVAQVLLALGEGRPPAELWVPAAEEALDSRHPEVRAAAAEALGMARATDRLGRILALASDESTRVRQAIPDAILRLKPQRALGVLEPLSLDDSWRVRVATARALGEHRSRKATALLIDMLAREEGRVREDVLVELRELTKQDFGLHVDAWQRFLERAPPDFLNGDGDGEGGAAVAGGSVVYYGLVSLTKRFVLVTDLSGSMSTHERGGYRMRKDGTRLEITQAEMEQLLEGMDSSVAINLLTFTSDVRRWSKRLVPLNAKGKKKALAELASYRADGSTNVFGALEACFDMAEESLDAPQLEDATPDTIFLLTDGAPSAGALQDVNLILEYVAERNRELMLRIHCIALATDPVSREFMSRIARLTTGEYVNPLDG